MHTNRKIRLLVICCVLILGVLCLVQFYLIRNTYNLNRDKYYQEVREAIGNITTTTQTDSMYYRALAALKSTLIQYQKGQIGRNAFYTALKTCNDSINWTGNNWFQGRMAANPLLRGVQYKYQFDEVILYDSHYTDTLLAAANAPFVFMGNAFATTNTLQIGYGAQLSPLYPTNNNNTATFRVQHRQCIDISQWQHAVWTRMAGVLALAVGLIAAVILLFFFVFRALLHQKRIADMKTDFANNITHELKTPLSSLNIITKSLRRSEVQQDAARFEDLLQSLERQHAKLQYITDSVLESAMLPQTPVLLHAVNLPAFIRTLVSDFKNTTHYLHVEVDSKEQLIHTDTDKLQTILYNLLDNATKYSAAGTNINIRAFVTDHLYGISVHDEGTGIAQHEQARIFEQFYRVPEGDIHSTKGLGLGLYLSTLATLQLGGTLGVQSTPGKGSIFTLNIPLYENL